MARGRIVASALVMRHRQIPVICKRRLRGSGRPVLGERGELELVCRRARVLVGKEEDGVGDPARVGERFRRDTGAC
jgi:hypothetical protein